MEKHLREKINRWIDFSEAIKKIYLKIINYEQRNYFGEGYQNLIYLLSVAFDIEDKIIEEININQDNWRQIKTIIDCQDDFIEQITEEKTNAFDVLRRSNTLDDILLYVHNNFYSEQTITNIFELVALTNYRDELNNLKYADVFLKHVTVNFIAMIQKYINEVDDEEIRNYLIYLKYAIISTTPGYEKSFTELLGQTLPTININTDFPSIEGFSEEGIDELNRYNLKNAIGSDLVQAFCIDNNLINESSEKKLLYRILALNKARLISLRDDSFVTELEEIINDIRPTNPDYSIVNTLVDEMFKDAHELAKKDYYIAKKVRK